LNHNKELILLNDELGDQETRSKDLEVKQQSVDQMVRMVIDVQSQWLPLEYINLRNEPMNLPKSLIHKYSESKLSKYFENENVLRDNLGNVKVDRDPECFRFVINLIRNGNIG
jgi:hypothetical protein